MTDDYRPHRRAAFDLDRGSRYECEPTTIAALTLAVAAAGTATSVQQQRYNASAQEQQQGELTKANNSVANEQSSLLRQQEAQNAEAAARANEQARQASQRAQASAVTAAGEAGVTGGSYDALLQEYGMQLGQFRDATNRQQQLSSQATNSQVEAVRQGAQYGNLQINAPIAQPNYAAAAVDFAGQALAIRREYRRDQSGGVTQPTTSSRRGPYA